MIVFILIMIFFILITKIIEFINNNFTYKEIVELKTGEICKLKLKKFNILLENNNIKWDNKIKLWVI
jgi:hypothetical protein